MRVKERKAVMEDAEEKRGREGIDSELTMRKRYD
jgi:hypothetical protein